MTDTSPPTDDRASRPVRPFLSDRPVEDIGQNSLWGGGDGGGDEIIDAIQAIAQTVVEPLLSDDTRSPSLTFAIFGSWGSGKSSAMRIVRNEAQKLAQEINAERRLLFCDYNGPINEALFRAGKPVLRTLALRILSTLVPTEELQNVLFIKHDRRTNQTLSEELAPADGDSTLEASARRPRALQEVAIQLSDLIEFDRIIARHIRPKDEPTNVLIVLIDDLDRCDHNFVWEVLSAIQQLGDVPNLFFILASDRALLLDALRKRPGVGEDVERALEKYIQYTAAVPEVEERTIRAFVDSLGSVGGDATVITPLAAHAELIRFGLRKPTPRSIKRWINSVQRGLKKLLENGVLPTSRQVSLYIKERLLEHTWPDFYKDTFVPLSRDPIKGEVTLIALERICEQYKSDRFEARLRFELNTLDRGELSYAKFSELRSDLALFLGVAPFFRLDSGPTTDKSYDSIFRSAGFAEGEPRSTARPSPQTGSAARVDDDTDSAVEEPRQQPAPSDAGVVGFTNESADRPGSPIRGGDPARGRGSFVGPRSVREALDQPNFQFQTTGLIDQLRGLLFEAQAAVNQQRDAGPVVAQALELIAANIDYFRRNSERTASDLGDIAGHATNSADREIVVTCFRAALTFESSPRVRLNNLHRYVGYVLANELEGLYPEAQDRVMEMQEPPLVGLRDDFTRLLAITLASRISGDVADADMALAESRADIQHELKFVSAVSALGAAKRYNDLRQLAQERYLALTTPDESYNALRLLADALGTSDVLADQQEAIDLYRFIITHVSCKSPESRDDMYAIALNCANILFRHDYDSVAGELYFYSYRARKDERIIQRAYSSYLARARRPDLASKVLQGQLLRDDEKVVIPSQELPARLAPDELWSCWLQHPLYGERCAAPMIDIAAL